MKIYLSFNDLDEIQRVSNAVIDAHPDCIALPIDTLQIGDPPAQRSSRATCDNELTLGDLSLYEAGRLRVFYHLVDIGFFSMEQVSKVMEVNVAELSAMRNKFGLDGSITAQRDAIIDVMIRNAENKLSSSNEQEGKKNENKL